MHHCTKSCQNQSIRRRVWPVGEFMKERYKKISLYFTHLPKSPHRRIFTKFVTTVGAATWPITKKFGTGDYVGGPYGYDKFGENPSMGGFWANGWNITKNYFFIYTFFSWTHLQVRPVDGFSRLWLKRRGLAQGCAFWGFRWHCFRVKYPRKPQFLGRE